MEKLRPDTFVHELSPGVLQVGSRPDSMVILSNLSAADVAWVQGMRVPRPRTQGRSRRTTRVTKKQRELLGYLDAAGLLASSVNALAHLHVRVVGLDAVGARVARLLAGSGVAALDIQDRTSVDASVESAYSNQAAGLVRQTALRAQILKQHPEVRVGAITEPDLVIVCGRRAWDHGTMGRLLSQDRTHLPVTQDNQSVTVGPLIAPGVTACALCVDLHKQDAQPLWAKAAFAMAAAPAAAAPDYLAMAAAGLTVAMVEAVASSRPLQGDVEPLGRIGGPSQSWTVTMGGVQTQRWTPHPRCTCSSERLSNLELHQPAGAGTAPAGAGAASVGTPAGPTSVGPGIAPAGTPAGASERDRESGPPLQTPTKNGKETAA